MYTCMYTCVHTWCELYCNSIYRGLGFCVFNRRYYTNNTGSKALVVYSLVMYTSETTFLVVLQIDVVAVEVVGGGFKLVCSLVSYWKLWNGLCTLTQKSLPGCLCKLCNFIFNPYLTSNSPKFYLHTNSC